MEQELFGGESSASAEEDSSEESSGEGEINEGVENGEKAQEGEVGGGGGGGGEGQADQESSSSSSSGDSGSASEGEDSGQEEGGGAITPPSPQQPSPQAGSQPPNTKDLFGAESSSSSSGSDSEDGEGVGGEGGGVEGDRVQGEGEEEGSSPTNEEMKSPEAGHSENPPVKDQSADGTSPPADGPSQTVEGLFGDAADLTSSDEEGEGEGVRREGVEGGTAAGEEERMEEEVGEGEIPRINVEIPRCVANLGTDQYFVKLPNFLSVETRPFDPALYEDEVEDENEVLDEEGRARLKLKVENTIRWRYSQDELGNEVRESNARVVRWSDGSMSLFLGSEIFDIYRQPLQGEFSHLFVRQGTGLQGQAVFQTKLTFRPHSTDSQTHRKMTLSIADRFSKTQKIRVLPAVGKDPESQKKEKIKKEEEKLRAAVRRENQMRRIRERHSQRGLTAVYLEPDREDDEGLSLSAIKSSVRGRFSEGKMGRGGGWGGDSEGDSSDEEGAERLMRAKADEPEPMSRKHHMEPPEAEPLRKKQPRRKMLSSDDESSD